MWIWLLATRPSANEITEKTLLVDCGVMLLKDKLTNKMFVANILSVCVCVCVFVFVCVSVLVHVDPLPASSAL